MSEAYVVSLHACVYECLQYQYCVLAKKKVEPYGTTFMCCLQLRNPKEVSTEEYNEFYKKTFNEYLDPLASSHFTTEVYVFAFILVVCCFFVLVIQWLLLRWLV